MQKSESVASISKALSSFQAEVKNPHNTADNPFFKSKYAPLNEILNDVRPLLAKHGLSVIQSPSSIDGQAIGVTTTLLHESGEWIETDPFFVKAEKVNAQGAGSCVTYIRRYSLSAILGISSEDDDDGNHVSKPEPPKEQLKTDIITEASIKALHAIRNDRKVTEDEFKAGLSQMFKREIKSLKDLSEKEARSVIKVMNQKKESA